jgi:shikimate kinase
VNIYLIGFMGSGKSTTGRKIASSLHWSFIDTDRLIEEHNGLSVEELFTLRGEQYFREAERKALMAASVRSRTVVACGGGTPCSEENLGIMKETGVILYLKLPVDILVSRLEKSKTVRPLLLNNGKTDLEERVLELLEKRTVWYEQADIITDGQSTTEKLTGQLAELIRDRGAFL